MRRDLVFLSEMIDAAEQAMALVAGRSIGDIEGDRRTRDALLWKRDGSQRGCQSRVRADPRALSWDSVARADPVTKPSGSWLLVHRRRDRAHDCDRQTPGSRRHV